MKKLLIAIALCVFGIKSFAATSVDCNTLLNNGKYSLASSAPLTNCPAVSGDATVTVTPMANDTYRNEVLQTAVTSTAQVFGRYRTGTLASPTWSSWIQESGSPLGLTDAYIFVGNSSNVATGVPVSGAMTLANTGAFTPVTASFFTLPSTGNINNVLTGGQTRTGTVAFTSIAGNGGVQALTGTYGTACTTSVYAITLGIIESTANLPLVAKVKTVSTSGFTAEIVNESTTASSTGTLNYVVNCH